MPVTLPWSTYPAATLSQFVPPGTLLPLDQAIEMAFKACGAFDYAFRQGIIHRDVKPANIMVVSGSNIKVVDFGAAYLHNAAATQITNIGSPGYMSPEQLQGGTLGFHSDMFSLGVVLYELFTGERPFVGRNMAELFSMIALRDPLPPSRMRAELPEGVDRFVMRMLQKQPDERYPSWAELALDIADVGSLGMFRNAIPDSERFAALRRIPILAPLSDPEIWELVYAAQWRRVQARTVLMREGEEGGSLYFLARGRHRDQAGAAAEHVARRRILRRNGLHEGRPDPAPGHRRNHHGRADRGIPGRRAEAGEHELPTRRRHRAAAFAGGAPGPVG
jgi:hypothetical protein